MNVKQCMKGAIMYHRPLLVPYNTFREWLFLTILRQSVKKTKLKQAHQNEVTNPEKPSGSCK